MYRYLIPLLAVLAILIASTGPPVSADHEGTLHCPTDPTADRYVDIFDLSEFAGAFNQQPAPPELDIVPALVGDGVISVTGELATVAGDFGETCIGNTELFADPVQTEAFGASAWGCRSVTSGQYASTAGGYVGVAVWGGNAFCNTQAGFTYRFQCTFEWLALYPDGWHLVAVSQPGEEFGPRIYGGQYCGAPGFPAFLPCGRLVLGHANINVVWMANGQTLFNSFMPEPGFGFQAC